MEDLESFPQVRRIKLPKPAFAQEGTGTGEVDSEIYREVGREVLEERLEPVAWARALAESKGSREDALSHYVRYRMEGLSREKERARNRESMMAQRMAGNFRDFNSEPINYHPPYAEERGPMKLVEVLFWHTVAVVGVVGCLLALGLVWPQLGVHLSWGMSLGIALFMQAIPIAGWLFGRRAEYTLPYAKVARMAAVIAMLSSVVFGVKLLANPSNSGGLGLYQKEVREKLNIVKFPSQREKVSGRENGEAVELAER